MPRQGKAVVLVNAAISAVIVAVVAGVSVFRSPAAPPTVQEFAPANPARQLTEQASPQPATKGRHESGRLARPRNTPGVPSALQCWAWPDGTTTQTFDRKSPPCQSSWDVTKGNGGTTAPGVTRTEVRVGVASTSVAAWQPLAAFFSRHYQLYGRALRLVPLGPTDLSSAEGQRAAGEAAAEHGVFAVLAGVAGSDEPQDLGVLLDTLSRHRVVAVLTRSTRVSSTALAADSPYGWSVLPPLDAVQRSVGTAVCRELSGHRAEHSDQTSSLSRRFAVLAPPGYDVDPLSSVLDGCHQSARVVTYDPRDADALRTTMIDLKRDAVTTLIPFDGASRVAVPLMAAANRASYRPEWLLPGLSQQEDESVWSLAPVEQRQALFGLADWESPRPASEQPAAQALHEVAPGTPVNAAVKAVYDGLALVAAGAQVAGPRLTAQAMADGLQTTSFANPGAEAAPAYQARVDLTDVDHTMLDDVAQVWWRDDRFCFVGRGRRWLPDSLPYSDPGFFDPRQGC